MNISKYSETSSDQLRCLSGSSDRLKPLDGFLLTLKPKELLSSRDLEMGGVEDVYSFERIFLMCWIVVGFSTERSNGFCVFNH